MVLRKKWIGGAVCVVAGVIVAVPLLHSEPPATQPAPEQGPREGGGGPGDRPMPPPGEMIERLRSTALDLYLTDEQRVKIEESLDKAKADIAALEEKGPEARDQIRDRMRQANREVMNALEDDQRQQLRQKMWGDRPRGGPDGRGGRRGPGGADGPGGPDGQRGPSTRPMMGGMIERLKDNLKKLELTPEQQTKVDALMAKTQEQLETLRKEAQTAGEQSRDKFRSLMESSRQEMQSILTPEQQEKLRDLMRQGWRGGPGGPGGQRGPDDRGPGGPPPPPGDGGPPPPPGDDAAPPPPPEEKAAPTGDSGGGGAEVGQMAPTFELKKLDGPSVQLPSFQGRVLVMEFGSWSCPSFRQRAAGMEQLKRDYGARAAFLVIYTKEAHPAGPGEVQRNRDEGIEVEQPRNEAQRRELAQKAKETLKITLPIAMDTMQDTTLTAYAAFPNAAVIIGRDGKIAARQQWTDPSALRPLIESALNAR